MHPTTLTATILAILTAAGATTYTLLPDADDKETPEEKIWEEDAATTFLATYLQWREHINLAQTEPKTNNSPSAASHYEGAALIAELGAEEFLRDHRHAPGINKDLYDESMRVLRLLESAALAMADCARGDGDCQSAEALATEADSEMEKSKRMWQKALED